MRNSEQRYHAVAIVLHWAIATAILGNILLGWWMHEALEESQSRTLAIAGFQLHKSIGLSVLVLSVLRLMWRFTHRPPPLPQHMPRWEVLAAKATHWAFYGLMILVPLSGWIYVSTQWRGEVALNVPTLWFGLFEVPHLLGLSHAEQSLRQSLSAIGAGTHEILAWSTGVLFLLHVGAALKHQFIDKDEVLAHMVTALDRGPKRGALHRMTVMAGLSAVAASAVWIALTLFMPGAAKHSESAAGGDIASAPGSWVIDPTRSEILFSGTHAGAAFNGRFTRWSGDVRIDPAAVERSTIRISIDTASASDGVALHERTLPQREWFNIAEYPDAEYTSNRIEKRDANLYVLSGQLRIKDQIVAVPELNLEIFPDRIEINGGATLSRREVNMGMESDPNGEWVSKDILVTVALYASAP